MLLARTSIFAGSLISTIAFCHLGLIIEYSTSSMCGRYRLSRKKQIIAERFDAISDAEDWTPRYNVDPTQPVPVIRQNLIEPTRHLSQMRWGADSFMVERCLWSFEHDQREIGNRSNVACISRRGEIPTLPCTSRCVLRMEASRKREAAILLRSERGLSPRLRWIVPGMEGRERYVGQNMYDTHDNT